MRITARFRWVLQRIYDPFFKMALTVPGMALVLVVAGLACFDVVSDRRILGSEFMPRLDEGDLLYMPTTDPSISVTKARKILQQTDKLIKTFPEV